MNHFSLRAPGALLACCLLMAGTGCTSLDSVSVNGVPTDRKRPVEASATNTAFLGLHFSNAFVNGLPDQLKAQCLGGKVTGVFTKHESTWYVLVQQRRVKVRGYCVYDAASARAQASVSEARLGARSEEPGQ